MASWTAPRTWVYDETVTASIMNSAVRDNFLETAPAKAAAKGDFFAATAANAIAAISVPSNYGVAFADSAEASGWNTGPVRTAAFQGRVATVENTVTETDVFSVSIPGGILGTSRSILADVFLRIYNNRGGSSDYTFKVIYGSTTMITEAIPQADSGGHFVSRTSVLLAANGGTGAQIAMLAGAGIQVASGITVRDSGSGYGSASEDSTGALTFDLTLTMEHADTDTEWECYSYLIKYQ